MSDEVEAIRKEFADLRSGTSRELGEVHRRMNEIQSDLVDKIHQIDLRLVRSNTIFEQITDKMPSRALVRTMVGLVAALVVGVATAAVVAAMKGL